MAQTEKPRMADNMVISPNLATNNSGVINKKSTNISSSSSLAPDGDNFPCGYCRCLMTNFSALVDHIHTNHSEQQIDTTLHNHENQISAQGK